MAKAKKKWYESATLWTNAGALAGLGSAYSQGQMSKEEVTAAGVMALVNILLRLKTDSSVGK